MKYDPWADYRKAPDQGFRDWEKMRGSWKVEFLVPVKSIIRTAKAVHKFFRRLCK